MIKLRTILVDDEPLALALIKSCLSDFPEIDVIAECRNGQEAIDATIEMDPDLMFLDIQMPGKNGFEVVKALQNDIMPMVIFVTTYQQYALEAFDLHAVDYIPKPLDEERLHRAVQRAIERHIGAKRSGHNKPPLIGAIDEVINKLSLHGEKPATRGLVTGNRSANKIIIRDGGTVTAIPETDIDWIDAAGDYMCIHVGGTTHIMRSTVKDLLGKLDTGTFKRIHRSTIVNIDRIHTIEPLSKGDYFMCLTCGGRLRVSRNFNAVVKDFVAGNRRPAARGQS